MTQIENQIVKILPGFISVEFDGRKIPDRDILLRLLRPDIDLGTAALVVSETLDSEDETKSQLILRSQNNRFVEWEPFTLKPDPSEALIHICQLFGDFLKSEFKWEDYHFSIETLRYHTALLNYIDHFFPKQENHDKEHKLKARSISDFSIGIKTGTWNTKAAEDYSELDDERRLKIIKIFPEYEWSEFCHQIAIKSLAQYAPGEVLKCIDDNYAARCEIRDVSRKNYRRPHSERSISNDHP